ncbi:MAG TPA: hypothetical protein VN695_19700 [Streptosporangiaceae bacterium]|nr:hypothetical protein [Streptosporangiaceae bacterium]
MTLALVICLVILGRLSRWRPLWLAVPAIAGVAWVLTIGVRPAVAGYLACGSRLLRLLARDDTISAKARGLRDMAAGWRHWLPGQLPFALIVAMTQAVIFSLPARTGTNARYRRGALVAARSGYLAATLRRGELATSDGCCLGIVPSTGRRAAVSWQEAEAGVLCAGQDAAAVSATGRDLALAAIQHRKTVVIIDLVGEADSAPTRGRNASLIEFIESECATVGAPLRRFGWRSAHYDPLSSARTARATRLTMAMIDWTGVGHARQLFCMNYLNAAFTVIAAIRTDQVGRDRASGGMLDEVVRLMRPGELSDRLAKLAGRAPVDGSLAVRVAEVSRQLEADPATLAPMAVQLAELNSAALAKLIRPAAGEESISIAAALAGREVALFSLDRPVLGKPATMIARLATADLIETLAERSDLGSRADCLIWIDGCEAMDTRQLAALVALGDRTGTAVVLGTALGSAAAAIAAEMNVVAVRGVSPVELTAPPAVQAAPAPGSTGLSAPPHDQMADVLAELHVPGCPDALSFAVRRPRPRLVAGCRVVR